MRYGNMRRMAVGIVRRYFAFVTGSSRFQVAVLPSLIATGVAAVQAVNEFVMSIGEQCIGDEGRPTSQSRWLSAWLSIIKQSCPDGSRGWLGNLVRVIGHTERSGPKRAGPEQRGMMVLWSVERSRAIGSRLVP
jgi:hypothetical protein